MPLNSAIRFLWDQTDHRMLFLLLAGNEERYQKYRGAKLGNIAPMPALEDGSV